MAIEITVPRLGWSMDEGTLTEWLKHDGEFVRKGEMLFVLEGDKAAQEIECFDEGILRLLPNGPRPGDTVRVGQLLAHLLAEGEEPPAPTLVSIPELATGPKSGGGTRGGSDAGIALKSADLPDASQVRSTPRARRRAAAMGVDWTKIFGTGRRGRIRERDVLSCSDHGESREGNRAELSTDTSESVNLHTPLRRTIAERMMASCQATAPVTLNSTADATRLVELRHSYQAAAHSSDAIVPSFTDFIMKLAAYALQSHLALNSRWEDNRIVISEQIHIGVAVDTRAGLMVPVVRNVEQLSLQKLVLRTRELIEQARSRRLSADSTQGGTFTVTNLGSYGIDVFTPIIQLPQCAILVIGCIRKAPIFDGSQFVARDLLTLSLTFDHRIVDGAPAARFLQAVCKAIETPDDLLNQ